MPKTKSSKTKVKQTDKGLEEKIERIVGKKIDEYFKNTKKEKNVYKKSLGKIFGEFFGLVLGLLIIIKLFPLLPFVTQKYFLWLQIGIYSTVFGTVFEIFKHISYTSFFKRIFEIVNLLVSLYSTYYLLKIFPFDFSRIGYQQINEIFAFALNIALFAIAVGIIVNFIRIFVPEKEK